jgi:predicted secreted hydrolase
MITKWFILALGLSLGAAEVPYREALPGYRYQFPRDYFEHPDFLTEWWYYTGNVRTEQGDRLGFELVFFRQGEERGVSDNRSSWRVTDLYLAHLALTDVGGKKYISKERLNRAGPGIAGASFAERRIWNGNWSSTWEGEKQTLQAVAEGIRLRLELQPLKPAVIHGVNGLSQKAEERGKASHYVSFTRLDVAGEINGRRVHGTAWMDHEWFTHALDKQQAGWDWFSLQLDDGADLMLLHLRRRDGSVDPYSTGTYVDRQGRARHLARADFTLEPLAFWTSPNSKARYPIRWRLRVPALGLALECAAALPNQELVGEHDGPSYWEGAVDYSGSASGTGYLEMTGYAKPMEM